MLLSTYSCYISDNSWICSRRAPNQINDKLDVQETIQLTVELAWSLKGIHEHRWKRRKKKGRSAFRGEKQRRASFTTRRAQMPLSKSSPNISCRGVCMCYCRRNKKKVRVRNVRKEPLEMFLHYFVVYLLLSFPQSTLRDSLRTVLLSANATLISMTITWT